MRALRVVGINEDGEVVLEDPGRRERYTVPADEQLRAATRGDLTRLGQIAIELESQLRPREIQARIRAGQSVEQVASAAGVPPQKIERFAYPVLLERSRIAEVAQRAYPLRSEGPDHRPLGEVVAHTFGLRGQEYTEAEWDSWKGDDSKWVVSLFWRAGRSDNRAHWTFHPGAHGGTVSAIDEHASDLVEGLPARPLRTVGPVIDIARQDEQPQPGPVPHEELRAAASDTARSGVGDRIDAAARGAGSRTDPGRDRQQGGRAVAEQRNVAPPAQRQAEPRVGESRAAENRMAEARAAESRAAESNAAGSRAAESRAAESRAAESRAAERSTVATRQPEPAAPEPTPEPATAATPTPEPPAPEAPAEPAPASTRRTKKGKPVMPSWDEVLLGVRGQR